VVLLHGTGQRKEDWRLLLGPLTARGFGVFSVDLRAHGESRISPSGEEVTWHKLKDTPKGPNDFEDMTRDVEAAVGYLGEHGVPEESIGLIGAEVGSSIAAKYAAVHPRVAFLGMLSPGLAWREVTTVNAIRAFSGRAIPILMVHSDKDKVSGPATPLLYAFAKRAVGDKHAGLIVVPEERGTKMLKVNIGLAEKIAAWVENPATALPVDASTAPAAAVGTPETTKGAILIDGNGVHEAPSGDSGRR
jgi:pimeloyl-ACP methyl ester carboxylesterase